MILFFLGYQCKNGVIWVVDAENALACAHHCTLENEPKCRSFNFIEDPAIVQNCKLVSRAYAVAVRRSGVSYLPLVRRSGVSYFEKIKGVASCFRLFTLSSIGT